MGLISFKDWLLQQESSAFTRMRDNPFYRKLISPAAMHSRSTWPGGIEVVPKKKKKSKKNKSKKKHMSETWQSVSEGKAKQPDYSFDQWLLKALSKKIEIEDLLDDADVKEKELESKKGDDSKKINIKKDDIKDDKKDDKKDDIKDDNDRKVQDVDKESDKEKLDNKENNFED